MVGCYLSIGNEQGVEEVKEEIDRASTLKLQCMCSSWSWVKSLPFVELSMDQ